MTWQIYRIYNNPEQVIFKIVAVNFIYVRSRAMEQIYIILNISFIVLNEITG